MTADEYSRLADKLDCLAESVTVVREDVATLKTDAVMRAKAEAYHELNREATCPLRPFLSKAQVDRDALFSDIRTLKIDVTELKTWESERKRENAIIEARVGPLRTLTRWGAGILAAVVGAVLIAYFLLGLGLQK